MRNGLTVGEGLAPPALLIYLFCNGRTKALPYGAKRSQPKFTTLNYTANPNLYYSPTVSTTFPTFSPRSRIA